MRRAWTSTGVDRELSRHGSDDDRSKARRASAREDHPHDLNDLYRSLLREGRRDGRGGLSPRTVRYAHAILRKALSDAVRLGYLETNPTLAADPPSVRAARARQFPTWGPGDLRRFLNFVREDRFYAAFYLAAASGMRRGELLGLRWCDLDLDAQQLSVVQCVVEVAHAVRTATKSDRSRRDDRARRRSTAC